MCKKLDIQCLKLDIQCLKIRHTMSKVSIEIGI
jgi:hypothetical protein